MIKLPTRLFGLLLLTWIHCATAFAGVDVTGQGGAFYDTGQNPFDLFGTNYTGFVLFNPLSMSGAIWDPNNPGSNSVDPDNAMAHFTGVGSNGLSLMADTGETFASTPGNVAVDVSFEILNGAFMTGEVQI